jgi:hypothetical protein
MSLICAARPRIETRSTSSRTPSATAPQCRTRVERNEQEKKYVRNRCQRPSEGEHGQDERQRHERNDDSTRREGVIDLSRASYRKMLRNLGWAVGYNVLAIPVAAGVLAPWRITCCPRSGRF